MKIGEWPVYFVTITDATGREPMHMHFLWVASRGMIYQMIGLASERHREVLRKTAMSFRPLTGDERSKVTVIRLRIVSGRDGEDLRQLSSRTGNVWDLQTTAVMNDLASRETLAEDQLVKIAVSEE